MKHLSQAWQEMTTDMQMLQTPAVYIADVHAEARSLQKSLHRANIRDKRHEEEFRVHPAAQKGSLIITGDFVDGGYDHVGVFDVLEQCRAQMKTIIQPGNHEIMMLEALRNQDSLMLHSWLERGGLSFLREIAIGPLIQNQPLDATLPIEPSTVECIRNLSKYLTHGEQLNMIKAFPIVRDMVLNRARYASLFSDMQLVHAAGGILSVHAGIDLPTAKFIKEHGLQKLNDRFTRAWEHGNLLPFIYTDAWGGPLNMRRGVKRSGASSCGDGDSGEAFDEETATILREMGIKVVIHGHDHLREGRQQWKMSHGILEINNDVGMALIHNTPTNSGSVTVKHDGSIIARNDVFGQRKIAQIQKKGVKTYPAF